MSPNAPWVEQALAVAASAGFGPYVEAQPFARSRGRRRTVLRVRGAAGSAILVRRENPDRGARELEVLRELHARGAPVPQPIAFRDGWLVQEDLGTRSLCGELVRSSEPTRAAALDSALSSLMCIQRIAEETGLGDRSWLIGGTPRWRAQLASRAERVGSTLGLPAPGRIAKLADAIAHPPARFIKWDARPGNAALDERGKVYWFDWEHCGLRSPLDDLVWLVCDEWTPAPAEEFLESSRVRQLSHADEPRGRCQGSCRKESLLRAARICRVDAGLGIGLSRGDLPARRRAASVCFVETTSGSSAGSRHVAEPVHAVSV